MKLGSIVRRAASAFGKSKTRGTPTTTGPRTTTGGRGSAKSDLASGAAKMAKKKL